MPNLPPWLAPALTLLAAPVLAILLLMMVQRLLDRVLRAEFAPVLRRVTQGARTPLRAVVALLAILAVLPEAGLTSAAVAAGTRLLDLALAGALGWTITRMVAAIFDAYLDRARTASEDEFHARRRTTQLTVFRRFTIVAGIALTAGFVLTAIPAVRTVGLSLFASAGVAGIVAGLAARPAVSSLLAGLQIAVTQPVRIGDAVVVEGVFGHVEEITSTYVTIATWDQRSLILPLSYLLEHPFVNWSRHSPQLLDTVMLYLDYGVPLAELRAELQRILAKAPLWDQRVSGVQVTDMKENCMEVRVLLSAANAPRMFDLRCQVREGLIDWLVQHTPTSLPRVRTDVPPTAGVVAANDQRGAAA
jgi:small-conductance mechanosensitive channel